MSLSDEVRHLEARLAEERKLRRDADDRIADIRDTLVGYHNSTTKPWGRTLQKIGRLVGIEVENERT